MIECQAEDCGKMFLPKTYHQKFCSDTCRWRFHKQKLYTLRGKKGLCVQCGGKMIENEKISYCSECKLYFRERYFSKKKGSGK